MKIDSIIRGMGRREGFTITELTAASAILLLVIAMSMSGFIYALKGVSDGAVQDELDINVQKAMERLKRDLRLSSLDKMYFYAGSTVTGVDYDAISFPMARDDDGDGAVETNSQGLIEWDETLIYHVSANPFQLKLTSISPRNNSLNDAQCMSQLVYVVSTGGVTNNNDPSATVKTNTQTIFENLFTWSISKSGTPYNGYKEYLSRKQNQKLGSVVLTPGYHTIKFKTVGTDSSLSNGYAIGIDSVQITPSRCVYEAEETFWRPVTNGSTISRRYMLPYGTWSGDYHLYFPATATGSYFTAAFTNDQWHETTFWQTGERHSNTVVAVDGSQTPSNDVVQLEGLGTNWTTAAQTGDPVGMAWGGHPDLRGAVVRVLLKGNLNQGPGLNYNGAKCKVLFHAGQHQLTIDEAYIAQSLSNDIPVIDATGTQNSLGGIGIIGWGGAAAYSPLTAFEIDKMKSYVVSFRIKDDDNHACTWKWTNPVGASASCWVSPPGGGQLEPEDNTWSASPTNYYETNCIIAVEALYTTYPSNGVFESQVFDTHKTAITNATVYWVVSNSVNSRAQLQARSCATEDMATAPSFDSLSPIFDSTTSAAELPVALPTNTQQFLQFRATLYPSADTLWTPKVKDVTFTWSGDETIVDLYATFTTGPEYGKFLVYVDDKEIVRSLSIDLEIFKDTMGFGTTRRITSALSSQIQPRNTAK